MHMHRWNPAREHSQHFDDIIRLTPHSHPLRCVLKQACSHSENGAGVGERARASWEEEGPLVSKWRERRHFWGRRRVADCAMIYDWHTRTHWKEKEAEYCCVLRVLLWAVFAGGAFFLNLKQSSQRFYPSPFWILLCWNGDAWLCGLASGQQALVENTSLTGQLYSSVIPRSVFDARAQAVWKAQLGSTSWISLPGQLLTLLFYTMSLTITCGG